MQTSAVQSEHALVLDKIKIKQKTTKDREFTKLAAAMQMNEWMKTDPDLKPNVDPRAEL